VAVAAGNNTFQIKLHNQSRRQREIPKVDVVIDFSPAPRRRKLNFWNKSPCNIRNSTRAPPLSDTRKDGFIDPQNTEEDAEIG